MTPIIISKVNYPHAGQPSFDSNGGFEIEVSASSAFVYECATFRVNAGCTVII
jgi:hypothetical protein